MYSYFIMTSDNSYSEPDPSDAMQLVEFRAFLSQHYSSSSFMYVVLGFFFFNLVGFHASGDYTIGSNKSWVENTEILLRLMSFVCPTLIWLLKKDGSAIQAGKIDKNPVLLCIQTAYPIIFSLSLMREAFQELPGPGRDVKYQALFGMMFFPFTVFFLLRDTHRISMLFSLACSIYILANAFYFAPSWDFFACFTTYLLVTAFIFYDWTQQTKRMFMLVKKLQNTLKENEKLAVEAQALELRAMIGNVAHDLKTPLTSLSTGIEFMQDVMSTWKPLFSAQMPNLPAELASKVAANCKSIFACLNSMQGTNSFMTMTINRCLDYTKASKGFKLVPKLETVNLQAALEMPVQLMRDVQDNIQIQVLPLSAEVCVHAITDKQWLTENLLCLLSNAVKYSHKGCVQVAIKLEKNETTSEKEGKEEQESFLRFEVQDSGVGLSDEAMQKLFNPFKQAQRLAGGTGLGLFSLANRVEALQGQYGVKHRPDGEQGSLFWFTIPFRADELSDKGAGLTRADSDPIRSGVSSIAVAGSSAPNNPQQYKLLVVDDAPLIVKMTTMLLQRKGHTVQHAVNGADALEKLMVRADDASSPDTSTSASVSSWIAPPQPLFDVVLMDLQMPVLDGIEAIRRLRAAEKRRDVTASVSVPSNTEETLAPPPRQLVIALSANSDEETRQEALAAGADVFLSKPFTYENFLDVINSHVK